jgi:hypothetical protein
MLRIGRGIATAAIFRPRVRYTVRAMVLLLYLLMSFSATVSGSDWYCASVRAPAGALPSAMPCGPLPPSSAHSAAKLCAAKSFCSSTFT